MSSNNLFRIGGIAAILSVVLSLGAYALPAALTLGSLVFAVFIFVLYRLFSDESSLSLIAAVVAIIGAVALAILSLPAGAPNNALTNLATWAAWFLPPLAFGFIAYQHSKAGMPRALALIGMVAGVFGLLNLILTLIGGGDWSKPNNPALSPLIMGTYYIGMLLGLAWIVWTGILLLRRKSA